MSLQGRATSSEAQGLVADLMLSAVMPAILKRQARLTPASEVKCTEALGAILADIINAAWLNRASFRSVRNESFDHRCPVGRLAFHRVMDALVEEGLVDTRKGHRVRDQHNVAALPVHDCMIVPRSLADAGQRVLQQAFYDHLKNVAECPHPFLPLVKLK